MPSVSERYHAAPHQWNLGIMITIGGILWTALAFYISVEINSHSVAETAHPQMNVQLKEIRSDQIKERIFNMDQRICEDPNNTYYKQELLNLIDAWEKLNAPRKFPIQLLKCGK